MLLFYSWFPVHGTARPDTWRRACVKLNCKQTAFTCF